MLGRTFKHMFALSLILVILVAGCGNNSPAPPTVSGSVPPRQRTATPVPATDEEAIRQLINAECEAVVQQDVDRLEDLWTSSGVVSDAGHTKDNTGDDVTWKNWDALRDYYVNVVFPSNPTFCEHFDIKVAINGANATATNSLKIGVTNCQDCNIWTLNKGGDGWRIQSLTFNITPQ